jgi:hypothetical protein
MVKFFGSFDKHRWRHIQAGWRDTAILMADQLKNLIQKNG